MTTQIIPTDQFSKDHWSLLGYIESRVNSRQVAPSTGELNKDHIRINPNGDYGIIATPLCGLFSRTWNDNYGTRLVGYFKDDNTTDETKCLPKHDDVNCLIDLEYAGIIEIISLVNFYIKLTKKGQKVVSELREWKNKGNQYYNFKMSTK